MCVFVLCVSEYTNNSPIAAYLTILGEFPIITAMNIAYRINKYGGKNIHVYIVEGLHHVNLSPGRESWEPFICRGTDNTNHFRHYTFYVVF